MTLREITTPVDLCRPDGRLAPDAVGWTRQPLHRPNLRGWGRTKRWEYWGIVLDSHVIGLTISSLDYAGVEAVYLLDRETGRETLREVTAPLARGVELAPSAGRGTSRFRGGGLELAFTDQADGSRLEARFDDVEIDLLAARVPGQESLGVVVPWSERRFQYTVKDVCRPASGGFRIGSRSWSADGGWAVLDHGRGRWPYAMAWNWAAGSGVVEVTFTPHHLRTAATNLLVVASRTHQCFGEFTGWATGDDGARVRLDGLTGWAEEVRNRW